MNLNLTGLPDDVIAAMQEAHWRGIEREEIVLPTTPYELVEPTRLELESTTATSTSERPNTELNSNSLTISVDENDFPDTAISTATPTELPSLPDFEDDDEEDEDENGPEEEEEQPSVTIEGNFTTVEGEFTNVVAAEITASIDREIGEDIGIIIFKEKLRS